MEERQSRPPLPPPPINTRIPGPMHQHQVQMVIGEGVIVRWCMLCGKTWRVPVAFGPSSDHWTVIAEPYDEDERADKNR